MNDKTEFDSYVDTEIEIDPRPRLKAKVAEILERELEGVPADVTDDLILPSRLQPLATRCKDAIESGHSDRLDRLLLEFAGDLRRVVAWERREGALKPLSVLSECKRVAGRLSGSFWNGFEQAQLLAILTPDDLPILKISYREISTTVRVISRGFQEATRPVSISPEHWRSLGTSENEICEAEQAAQRVKLQAERPSRDFAGPGKWPGPAFVR
jgi:hypothetical protein